jgi:hypothetical protein
VPRGSIRATAGRFRGERNRPSRRLRHGNVPKFTLATARRKWSYSRAGRVQARHTDITMPSLIKLLTVVGLIGALGYAAMFALATFVDPRPREMVVTVPPDRFVKQPH